MNVEQIKMNRIDALQAYQHYKQAVHSARTGTKKEWRRADAALMRGYKALSEGKRVLDLQKVMAAQGLRPDFYPKLAVCRADATTCFLQMGIAGSATFSAKRWSRGKNQCVAFPEDTFPRFLRYGPNANRSERWNNDVETLVPLVPPQLRPPHDLSGYHILWEVEEWRPVPSRDPMLLKSLGGSLYVVLATWDLTPLEMAVLR